MNTDNREDLQQLIGSDYQLQWVIGHGGMSTVWLADDPVHDREVAIKVLRPEFSANQEFLTRFRNEALAAEGIDSPNVVATFDYREVEAAAGFAMCFIVMEFIRGESLADLIARETRLEEALALDVLEQAAHGLAAIHRMGLVHRDIKPGNLMITQNGQVKITDFGIAKAAAAVPLTRTGMVVGTAQYVSPEQAQGLAVTSASDVYSLGVVGYEMLAGKRPFSGDSSVSVALAHVSAEPPALSTTISAPARELIEIALRKDSNLRFRNGNEMQLAVAQVRDGYRPAQPAGGVPTMVAPEPSSTESTQMLASAAKSTTSRPVEPLNHTATAAPEKKGGFGIGVGIAAAILLASGGLAWAFTSGVFDNSPDTPTPTPPPTVITETQTIEPTLKERPTQSSRPESSQSSTREPSTPSTVSFEDLPESETPPPNAPSPAPPPPHSDSAPPQTTGAAPTAATTDVPVTQGDPLEKLEDLINQPGGGA